jgi:hypothetical protein
LHHSLVSHKMRWRKQSRRCIHVHNCHSTSLVQQANATRLVDPRWHQMTTRCYFEWFLVLECQACQLNRINANA